MDWNKSNTILIIAFIVINIFLLTSVFNNSFSKQYDVMEDKEFVEKYKKLRKLFELLGPHEVRLSHLEDYKWLSAIYTYYLKVVIQRPVDEALVQRFYDKTVPSLSTSQQK